MLVSLAENDRHLREFLMGADRHLTHPRSGITVGLPHYADLDAFATFRAHSVNLDIDIECKTKAEDLCQPAHPTIMLDTASLSWLLKFVDYFGDPPISMRTPPVLPKHVDSSVFTFGDLLNTMTIRARFAPSFDLSYY